ncbi:hypothetical protein [Absidia glauca]|uniref:C2H2-type domain-containing protein n=1 Tax=Absidia glauca TaxID=4829 RepID=A0A163J418_ABSGL|nr:hypothetical protein [Absidia glauca]
MMDQDTDNYDEDLPEMFSSWPSMLSVSTTSMSATTPHLIDSTIWLAPSHDTSTSMPQLPYTENEVNGYHQDTLMQTQPIDTVTDNEHLAELGTYRGGNVFRGNFQANVSTVFAPAIAPVTTTATATFTAPGAMATDAMILYLWHEIWMQELWMQEIPPITNVLPLNANNAGPAQRTTHPCPICNFPFSRPQELRRHMTSRHSMARNHHCPHDGCDRSFARADVLRRHLRNVHRRT